MGVIQGFGNPDHTFIGRAVIADKTIEARSPQLIKLPIPLPSIPVLTPLLSPILGGSNSNNKKPPTAPTTTTPVAAPQPSPTASSGSNDPDPPANGGDGGSSTSTGSSSSGSSGGVDGSSSSSTSSGDSSSSGTTPGDTTGSTPGSTTSDGDPGGDTSIGDGTSPTSSTSSNADTPTPKGGTSLGGSKITDPAAAGTGNDPSSGGTDTTGSGSGVFASHSISGTGSPGSQATQGGMAGAGGNNGGSGAAAKPHLQSGTFAGIIIVLVLAVLIGLFFVVRRRSRVRRHQQTNMWFSRFRPPSTTRNSNGGESRVGTFATVTDDHFNRPRRSSDFIPALPPMAEVEYPNLNGRTPIFVQGSSQLTSADYNEQIDRQFSTLPVRMGASNHFETSRSNELQYLNNEPQYTSESANVSIEGGPDPFSISIGSTQECGSSEESGRFYFHNDEIGIGETDIGGFHTHSGLYAISQPPAAVSDRNSAEHSTPSNVSLYSRPSTSATLAMKTAPFQPSANVPPTPALPTHSTDFAIKHVADPFSDQNPFER
ncbi:hypothetical protein GALMADRAFT_245818 [Galerina marginata CBS 339.88]|uniref:Uncharacterized protein n=1 Tax=Galerina marginata (strain CBS 339.88) TaxID=685588 RepID=A0A067TFC6_GALM3|nr:hypothetical protein GALMADRAFT_245818 [Galerina marginata CBS 339.88]